MFKVGDIIVGLPQASEEYLCTTEGVRCRVVRVNPDNIFVEVRLANDEDDCLSYMWTVDSRYFELEKIHIFYNEKENKISRRKINNDYKEII